MPQLLTIRFRDPAGLVSKEGGAAGSLAFRLAPQSIENRVYDETRRKMEAQFRDRGIDAEVRVVEAAPADYGRARGEFVRGALIGAGGIAGLGAIGWVLWRLIFGGGRR